MLFRNNVVKSSMSNVHPDRPRYTTDKLVVNVNEQKVANSFQFRYFCSSCGCYWFLFFFRFFSGWIWYLMLLFFRDSVDETLNMYCACATKLQSSKAKRYYVKVFSEWRVPMLKWQLLNIHWAHTHQMNASLVEKRFPTKIPTQVLTDIYLQSRPKTETKTKRKTNRATWRKTLQQNNEMNSSRISFSFSKVK